jgi:hypothetical protein
LQIFPDFGGETSVDFSAGRNLNLPGGIVSNVNPFGDFDFRSPLGTVVQDTLLSHLPLLDLSQMSAVLANIQFNSVADGVPVHVAFPDGSTYDSPGFIEVDFSVTSLTLVPEPSSLPLGALALTGLIACRRWPGCGSRPSHKRHLGLLAR